MPRLGLFEWRGARAATIFIPPSAMRSLTYNAERPPGLRPVSLVIYSGYMSFQPGLFLPCAR